MWTLNIKRPHTDCFSADVECNVHTLTVFFVDVKYSDFFLAFGVLTIPGEWSWRILGSKAMSTFLRKKMGSRVVQVEKIHV